MRRALLVLVCFVLLAVSACGDDDGGEDVAAADPTPTEAPTPEPSPTPTVTPEPELSWEDVVELLEPATVMIRADFPSTAVSYEGQGSGTGIVYTDDGYILTNSHVVSGAAALTIATSGSPRERTARFVGVSPCDDLAVIKVDDMEGLDVASLGTSGEARVGSEVAALGYPLGEMLSLDLSFSRGAISNMNESALHYENLIQHDAAINPGNSGGPLVNKRGEVIGVNSLGFDASVASGINYAIAIDQAKPVVEALQQGSNRLWLGMNLEPNFYPDYFGTEEGLVVAAVASGSSASTVGVRAPYLLTHLQGLSVNSMEDVCRILRSHNEGDSMKVDFMHVAETELQFLEGEVAIGDSTGGIELEVVHRVIFDEDQASTDGDTADQLTTGTWSGTAQVEVDYWAPCGDDNEWINYHTETFSMDAHVLIEAPLEGENNPYTTQIWTEPLEDEGGFWILSSWDYVETGMLAEYWSVDYDGTDVVGELTEYRQTDGEWGNVLYSNLPIDPCSDAEGFELAELEMDLGTVFTGNLGAETGSLEVYGTTADLFRDFYVQIDLIRTE